MARAERSTTRKSRSEGAARTSRTRAAGSGSGRSSRTTTDHDEIRDWVESHGGRPASVKGTGGKGDPGLLRIDYPGFSGERTLKPISWDEFFQAFNRNGLAFVYQAKKESRFSKLVRRETAAARARGTRASGARPRRAGAAASPSSRGRASSRASRGTGRATARSGRSSAGRSRSAGRRSASSSRTSGSRTQASRAR
jgi:hypothetical protein